MANNSHGDAGIAYHDEDFELIALANNRNGKWMISYENLEEYFIPKKDIEITKFKLIRGFMFLPTIPYPSHIFLSPIPAKWCC